MYTLDKIEGGPFNWADLHITVGARQAWLIVHSGEPPQVDDRRTILPGDRRIDLPWPPVVLEQSFFDDWDNIVGAIRYAALREGVLTMESVVHNIDEDS